MYENYHSHTMYSNVITPDSVTKPIEYIKRAYELGHRCYFSGEHGYQGSLLNILDDLEMFNKDIPKEKQVKMVVSVEAYYCQSIKQKDRKTYHLILVAKNNDGVEQLNSIVSDSNEKGYHYKPRVDREMIKNNLNPKNFICTSACVGGILSENNIEYMSDISFFKSFFKENFYIEIQNHTSEIQKKHSVRAKKISTELGIPLIHANDSHYIYPEDSELRDIFLQGKNIFYQEESGFCLDYPDTETIFKRYENQGIFTKKEVEAALKNTLIFRECEEITLYNKDIKMPKISENPSKEYKDLLNKCWIEQRKSIPKSMWKTYLKEIRDEADIVAKTNMEEYFILNNKIVENAKKKYGAFITPSGRGSAGSFYTNTLLGLTGMDRITSPVKLYPTRFMSVSRILETKSLPDVDINGSNQKLLIESAYDIVGKENCGWMMSFGTLQDKGAFRLWCKAKGYDLEEYNRIAKDLDSYRDDSKWGEVIRDSSALAGVIESVAPSPCSMLLNTSPVKKHIGYIKIKDMICCNMTGDNCDRWKYLKDDFLQVKVLKIIEDTCKRAGIKIPTITELEKKLDKKVFDIYANGLTCTINQVDSDYATDLVKRYKPRNVSEVCAFVAAIRPGFKSLLENFIRRKPYTTGVKEIDDLLKDSFHYLLYQESIMKYLINLGIDEAESYDIIKKISKKKFKEQELAILKEKLQKGWEEKIGKHNQEGFEKTWNVVEDASSYSFNASHSLSYAYDSLYVAYLKSHYPYEYYASSLDLYEGDIDTTARLISELDYFGIKVAPPKFRLAKGKTYYDKEKKVIYKGLNTIKYLNEDVGDYLYSLRDLEISSFLELENILTENKILNKKQIKILIVLGYFSEFGEIKELMTLYELYLKYKDKKNLSKPAPFPDDLIKKYCEKETAKTYSNVYFKGLVEDFCKKYYGDVGKANTIYLKGYEYIYTGCVIKEPTIEKNIFIVDEFVNSYRYYLKLININNGKRYFYMAYKGQIEILEKGQIIEIKEGKMINGKPYVVSMNVLHTSNDIKVKENTLL